MKVQQIRRFHMNVVAALLIGVLALGGATLWIVRQMSSTPPRPTLSADQSEQRTRLVAVTLADVWTTWNRLFRDEHPRLLPADIRYFVGTKTSPCGGADLVRAPFYCPRDRTLNFDLVFLEAIPSRLRDIEDQAGKLLIAQIAADAVLDWFGPRGGEAMERALRVDCLTGVWAADARDRLGDVPEGRYGLALLGARRILDSQETSGMILNSFGLGSFEERDVSFRKGYLSGQPETCFSSDFP